MVVILRRRLDDLGLLDDGDEDPGVCHDHHHEWYEVDGCQEEERERLDRVGVRPERHALLVLRGLGVGVGAPGEQLEKMLKMMLVLV